MDRQVMAAAAAFAVVAAYALASSLPASDMPADVPAAYTEQADTGQNERTTVVPMSEYGPGGTEPARATAEISVYIDRREYGPGEPIMYSVTNHGPGTASFTGASLWLQVRDLFENTVFGTGGGSLVTEIPPGSTVSDTWDQQAAGRGVQPGTYVLDFGGTRSWPFTITHENPAFYEPGITEGGSPELLVEKRQYLPGEVIRSALVNTGTEAVGSERKIEASVVDASGAVVDSVAYHQRDGIIEPGERIHMQPMGSPLVPPALGEYRIVTSDGLKSEPFVVDGPDPSKGPDATVRLHQSGTFKVSVYIDKLEYEVAEPIMVSITNHGSRIIKFSNTGLDFSIRDLSHKYIHLGSGFYSITPLEAGDTAERVLRHVNYGDVLYPGTYVIGFGGIESWAFTITHDNPAFYEPPTVEGYSVELLVEKQRYRPDEIVRWALVNTGTEVATVSGYGSSETAAVVDASGDEVSVRQYGWHGLVLEPGERFYGVWDGASYESWSRGKPVPPGEYHIVTLNGTRSAPFVIE